MFRNKRNYQVVVFNVRLICPSLHITNVWFTIKEKFRCPMLVTTQTHTRIFTNPNAIKEGITVQNQQISETEATCNCVYHAHKKTRLPEVKAI